MRANEQVSVLVYCAYVLDLQKRFDSPSLLNSSCLQHRCAETGFDRSHVEGMQIDPSCEKGPSGTIRAIDTSRLARGPDILFLRNGHHMPDLGVNVGYKSIAIYGKIHGLGDEYHVRFRDITKSKRSS